MNDVFIGSGNLAGKGVFADRDFREGELIVSYNLRQLNQRDFDALPNSEQEWVHSFWGKMYLFPEPARYVNNDDNPSTYPDLKRRGNFALRPIKRGEAITIDDSIELQNELDTFPEAYEKAANSRDVGQILPLIADHATFWFTNGRRERTSSIRGAFEDTYATIREERYAISEVKWPIATYWNAACTFNFRSEGFIDGLWHAYEGCGTSVLKRLNGSWRIVHEHLSKAL